MSRIKILIYSIWLKVRHPSIKLGGWSLVHPSTDIRIKSNGSLSLGRRTSTEKRVAISAIGGRVVIGDYTSINRNCIIVAHDSISIGSRVEIGPNVCIYDHDHVYDEKGIVKGKYWTKPILIGDGCWIGANVTILSGSMIGNGSVIGAGTLVKGIIPANTMVYDRREKVIKQI